MTSQPDNPQRVRTAFLIRDLGYGGAQRQLVALAAGLDPERFDVTVVSFYGGPQEADLIARGVRTITIGKRSRWDMLGFFVRTITTLRSLRPQILHTYLNESNLLGALLKPLLPGVRLAWGLRDSETDAALYGWLGKLAFRLANHLSSVPDLLIANSHTGAVYYKTLGYPAAKLQVIPNGIDTHRFQPEPSQRATLRAEWNIPADAFLIGLIGRISPMKDQVTALQALSKCPANVHLLIMGTGDESYLTQLKQHATERVHFSKPRSDMPAVYSALDGLVSSSAYGEGFSNVIGEAMACGLSAVGTRVGDTALIIGDEALTAPPRDPAALAAAMTRLTAPPATAPRQRILDHYTIARMVETTATALIKAPPVRLAIYTTGLGSGGAEMMLTQICGQLDRSRFSPVVISLTDGGKHVNTLEAMKIPVHTLGMKAGRPSLGSLLRLRSLARQIKPDLHIGWMYHGNLAATLAAWLGRSAPVIWNVRQSLYDLALEKRGSAAVIKLLAWISKQPRHIVYNSKLSAQQHEAVGYNATRTRLTANGFNTDAFRPDPAARASLREELSLPPQTPIVGRFGRHAAMKDYPTFLAAAALVRQQNPDVHFIVAGTDTQTLAAQPNVHLLGERQDIPRLTGAMDLACSSSAFGEGFPNVIAEAMCCAIPVVATDVGDSAWLLGTAGRIVPAKDPAALAAAVLEVLALPENQRSALGNAGRQRIVADFSLPAIVRSFETLLDSTLHPSTPQTKTQQPCVA